jgi:3-oxoacyl-[acyl-carrier protein] reductase
VLIFRRCSPASKGSSIEEISPCRLRGALPEMKLPGQNGIWHSFDAIGTIDDVNLSLQNRIALIAGSSRGIGKAIAMAFLREGCRVCITGRSEAPLSKALAEFDTAFGKERVISFCGDLTNSSVIEQALRKTHELWGRLDVVVANVGSGSGQPGWQIESEEWERLFRLNFWGSVNLTQAAIPLLAENRHGALLFIASITGVEATPAPLPYSAAKAALINYSKNLAVQVAKIGVRVNCIAPGNILFPGGTWERHLEKDKNKVMQMIDSSVPLARFGTPEEIADIAVFLCSDTATFITGACFKADGGQSKSY